MQIEDRKFNKLLGKREAEVMDILWDLGKASVRDILDVLKKKRRIAYTTVMTVMSRLHMKRVLKRKLDKSGAYIYWPVQNRKAFLTTVSKRAVNKIVSEFGEVAVAQFVDIIETKNIKNVERWRRKLKKLK